VTTWRGETPSAPPSPGLIGWVRVVLRGSALVTVTYTGLVLLLSLRLIERPVFGQRRPLTPWVTQAVCRIAFPVMGIGYRTTGKPMAQSGALVANHASWLDIFSLNAAQRVYFVSKSEVARWPVIGQLARATGTVFIRRDKREAQAQRALVEDRIRAGHNLLFFPEGTSTDGLRVQPFKSTLFEAFYAEGLQQSMHIQPVTVIYRAPDGAEPSFYGWWGDMDFGSHFLKTLAAGRQGMVEVVFHEPVRVAAFASRKELAAHCESVVRAALPSLGS